MNTGLLLSNIGVLLTLILGLTAIFRPQLIQTLVSIKAVGIEGLSEVRATYGGFFTGIALLALLTQSTDYFTLIGAGWLAASLVRLCTFWSGSFTHKNLGGVVFEGSIGALCCAKALF